MAKKKNEPMKVGMVDVYFDNPIDIFEPRVVLREVSLANLNDEDYKQLFMDYQSMKNGEGCMTDFCQSAEDLLRAKQYRDKFIREFEKYALKD